ncbi:LANO_0E01002g1_1 [Lachancea nothofagi CBS 11611]|uniref:LANO_0E01002g1_1 n=1 Tax=Lachancea nothofagi CBS 11611 TaxID=1266666 RepID=A0A1G4JP21_9SACH|nr:LANO_0E01002g1_1 [Lachancea nothofagi CBS 11611]
MVLWYKNNHTYDKDFRTVSLAFFNRYPNPYASHVLSIDTLSRKISPAGELCTTRLIKKTGRLPQWVKPFLGKISDSWIIEKSEVDIKNKELRTYTRNLDHTRIIQVEEFTTYRYNAQSGETDASSKVKFSSGFNVGVRNRIERWSHTKFDENVKRSRLGMAFVMEKLEQRRQIL